MIKTIKSKFKLNLFLLLIIFNLKAFSMDWSSDLDQAYRKWDQRNQQILKTVAQIHENERLYGSSRRPKPDRHKIKTNSYKTK